MTSDKYNLDLFIFYWNESTFKNHLFLSLMGVWGGGWLPEPEIHSASDNTACWECSAAAGPRRCSCPRASKMEAQTWWGGVQRRREEINSPDLFWPKQSRQDDLKSCHTHVHKCSSPDSLLTTSCSVTDEEEDLWRASMVEVFRGEGARRR